LGKKKSGTGPGEFNYPYGLTVDNEFIYICDSSNDRIQVLNKDNGMYSHQWGTKGTNDGQFNYPFSITLSNDDTEEKFLYVGDVVGVQLFTRQGQFQQKLLGTKVHGNKIGEFDYVIGLCVVNCYLYVSDQSNRRIQVWR